MSSSPPRKMLIVPWEEANASNEEKKESTDLQNETNEQKKESDDQPSKTTDLQKKESTDQPSKTTESSSDDLEQLKTKEQKRRVDNSVDNWSISDVLRKRAVQLANTTKSLALADVTEGFYVGEWNRSDLYITIGAVDRCDLNDPIAIHIARYALYEWNRKMGIDLLFKRPVRANQQNVNGVIYYLTFQASDDRYYQTKVFVASDYKEIKVLLFRDAIHYPEVQYIPGFDLESIKPISPPYSPDKVSITDLDEYEDTESDEEDDTESDENDEDDEDEDKDLDEIKRTTTC